MKFWEAIKALEEGQKIRCVDWPKDEYIYLKREGGTPRICDETDGIFAIHCFSPHDNWEIYEEPKKQEKMVSDGFGGFIYVEKENDDENFISLRMEIEDEKEDINGDLYQDYDKLNISLHKDEVMELIKILVSFL